MLVCAAGDVHGQLDLLYACIEQMEAELGRRVDLVVQVGDLGVWPDPRRIDGATLRHGGPGDFPDWHRYGKAAPRPTIFVPGNHEDFDFLLERGGGQILPGLYFLPWGKVTHFAANGESLTIGGIGGCFGSSDYDRKPRKPRKVRRKRGGRRARQRSLASPEHALMGRRRRHYLALEEDALAAAAQRDRLDILLTHEPPAGHLVARRPDGTPGRVWNTGGTGLRELVRLTRPRISLHGHLHPRFEREIDGNRVVGVAILPIPGSLLFLDVPPRGDIVDVAEWDGRGVPSAPSVSPPVQGGEFGEAVDATQHDGVIDAAAQALGPWRDAVLAGEQLDGEARRRIYTSLAGEADRRRMLMCTLKGGDIHKGLADMLREGLAVDDLFAWLEDLPPPRHIRQNMETESAPACRRDSP